jgi:lipopolysaccharide export LptBFGC system permease protein LptF
VKLQSYILRELCVDFTFAVGGMLVLSMPGIAVAAVSKLHGVDAKTVILFVPLLIAGLIPYVMPLGFLLSVVVTYGRLAADNEWTAIRMSGHNPAHVWMPAVLLALPLCVFTQWLIGEKLPRIRQDQERYQFIAMRNKFMNLSPGQTYLASGAFYLSAGGRDGDDFLDAVIKIPGSRGEPPRPFVAKRVHVDFSEGYMFVHLTDAHAVYGAYDLASKNPVFRIGLNDLQSGKESNYDSLRYKRSSQLQALAREETTAAEDVAIYSFEINHRRALSTTYLMFLLLGIPTGLLLRRGTQLAALAVAVAYALVYYVLAMRLSRDLATNHIAAPMLAAWAVNAAGALIGCWFSWKAMRQ